MKYLLIIALSLIACNLIAQSKMNEKRAMKEKHIDFTKEYLYFEIHGLIEIDGHTFKNDTCGCPIIYKADLSGITIIDACSKEKYKYHKCNKLECKIIHLKRLDEPIILPRKEWPSYQLFDGQIHLN